VMNMVQAQADAGALDAAERAEAAEQKAAGQPRA